MWMDLDEIKLSWKTACKRIGRRGVDNPDLLSAVVREVPAEYKQQFIEEVVNGVNVMVVRASGNKTVRTSLWLCCWVVKQQGCKAIQVAVDWGRIECVKYLVEVLNADINVSDGVR